MKTRISTFVEGWSCRTSFTPGWHQSFTRLGEPLASSPRFGVKMCCPSWELNRDTSTVQAIGQQHCLDCPPGGLMGRKYCHILPNTATYCQILPHIAKYCHILPNTAKYCQILPRTATYCQILPNTAKYCHILPHTAKYCHILPNTAKYCHILPNTATYCQKLPHTAKYCQILPKG